VTTRACSGLAPSLVENQKNLCRQPSNRTADWKSQYPGGDNFQGHTPAYGRKSPSRTDADDSCVDGMSGAQVPTSLMSLANYVTSKNFTFFSTRTIQCVTIRLTPDKPAKSVTSLTRLTYTSFLSQSIINQKNIARRQEAGIVRIQAQTIRPATFQRTERSRRTEPTPTIAPVIV
jgi:hypothetical protein